eukprot:1195962-Prorocentrum_minimum.AAC.1
MLRILVLSLILRTTTRKRKQKTKQLFNTFIHQKFHPTAPPLSTPLKSNQCLPSLGQSVNMGPLGWWECASVHTHVEALNPVSKTLSPKRWKSPTQNPLARVHLPANFLLKHTPVTLSKLRLILENLTHVRPYSSHRCLHVTPRALHLCSALRLHALPATQQCSEKRSATRYQVHVHQTTRHVHVHPSSVDERYLGASSLAAGRPRSLPIGRGSRSEPPDWSPSADSVRTA